MAYLYFIFICLIWGTNFMLMKKAEIVFGPISIAAWRVVGGVVVLGTFWFLSRQRWPLEKKHFVPLVLITIGGYIWPFAIQPYLISLHGSGFIGMMVSLVPLMTIAASVPMMGVYPTTRQLFGVVGGLVFVGLIFWERNSDQTDLHVPIINLLLAASVPLCYCVSNIYLKIKFSQIPALPLAFCALILATFVLLPLGLSRESLKTIEPDATGNPMEVAVVSLVALGVLGTGLATFMFYKLLQNYGPLFASMVTYIVPVIALFWGWLDDEEVTLLQGVGLIGILVMVAIVQFGAVGQTAKIPLDEPDKTL